MEIQYTCSERDFLWATSLLLWRRQRGLLFFVAVCGLVLLYAAVEMIISADFRASLTAGSPARIVLGFAMPTIIFLSPLLILRNAKKTYRKSPQVGEGRVLTLNDSGYVIRSSTVSAQVTWALYDSFYEDKHTFLLMQKGSQIFVPIPKRELSQAQVESLRSVLEGNILKN